MQSNRSNIKRDSRQQGERRESLDLDSRYGDIGISAVAAALRYGSDAQNTHHAPPNPAPWRKNEDA